jgi:hypothetical protein
LADNPVVFASLLDKATSFLSRLTAACRSITIISKITFALLLSGVTTGSAHKAQAVFIRTLRFTVLLKRPRPMKLIPSNLVIKRHPKKPRIRNGLPRLTLHFYQTLTMDRF